MSTSRVTAHHERFGGLSRDLYRAVEATSVTPFAPRAIDRGLAAVTVTLARHGEPAMTKPIAAGELPEHRSKLDFVRQRLRKRAENHRKFDSSEEQAELCHKVEARLADLLDAWKESLTRRSRRADFSTGTRCRVVRRFSMHRWIQT